MHGLMKYIVFFFCFSCSTSVPQNSIVQAPADLPSNSQKTYVESVEIDESRHSAHEVKLIVRGQLPSPAYKLDIIDVAVEKNQIYLTPYAYFQQKSTALQVLIPFQRSVTVTLASPGEYRIHLIGRASILQKNFTLN